MKAVKIFFYILLLTLMTKYDQKNENKTLYEEDGNTGTEVKAEETPKAEGSTTMEFYEKEYDFGTIEEGIMASHIFKFKNTGNIPLVISDARADCGCTVPTWTKDPVMPGQEGEIEVKYNSAGRGGQTVSKTVTVLANTEPMENRITIKAKVKEKVDGAPLKKE